LQAEDGIRDSSVTGVQTCALPIFDSAVRQVQGNLGNKDALRSAMMKAEFKSLRGGFKFNTNHYPVQDFYLVKVAKRSDGKYETRSEERRVGKECRSRVPQYESRRK